MHDEPVSTNVRAAIWKRQWAKFLSLPHTCVTVLVSAHQVLEHIIMENVTQLQIKAFIDNAPCYRRVFESDRGFCDNQQNCGQHGVNLLLAFDSDMNFTDTVEAAISHACE